LRLPRILPFLLLSSIVNAAEPAWHLFARDDGCVDVQIAARKLKLPRTPASPEDFAQMLRDRGEVAAIAPPAFAPAHLAGKIVEVQFGAGKTLVFIRTEACRDIGRGNSR